MRLLKILGYTVLIAFVTSIVGSIIFYRALKNGDIYQAGSGLGSVAEVKNYKYQQYYYEKYADTFLAKFSQYKVPANDPSEQMTSGYEFLNMTKFYFGNAPKEIYCVQWQGIDVRMAYNVDRGEEIIENPRDKVYIDESEKERISNRLRHEIIDKIDSLIANSKDKDSAILKRY